MNNTLPTQYNNSNSNSNSNIMNNKLDLLNMVANMGNIKEVLTEKINDTKETIVETATDTINETTDSTIQSITNIQEVVLDNINKAKP